MGYDLKTFEAEISSMKPRVFDTYILPAFLVYYAITSGKKIMSRNKRRILFVAGVYMGYRNYTAYKEALRKSVALLSALKSEVIV